MLSLIPPEIRPVINDAARGSRRGCSDVSDTFANFAYMTLKTALTNNETVLLDDFAFEDFSACEYLPELQQVLFPTDEFDENVTYETFVIVPDSIRTLVHELYGDEVEVNGPFVSSAMKVDTFYSLIASTIYLISCSPHGSY